MKKTEKEIALKLSAFLKDEYPDIIYRWDIGADMLLTQGQKNIHSRLQIDKRGYPDLFIAEPKKGYHGLYIELKRDELAVMTKKGILRKDKHNQEQFLMLDKLKRKGYLAVYGFGYEHTVKIIKEYLGD